MLATFKETFASLQDKTYGAKIISRPPAQVLWYWTKYLLLFSLIPAVLVIYSLTYTIPQLSRWAREYLPDGVISITGSRLETTLPQPWQYVDSQFAFIMDTTGQITDLASHSAGLLITGDKMLIKSASSETITRDFSDIPDFSLAKNQLVDWLSTHQGWLWFMGLLLVIIGLVLFVGFFWIFRMTSFLFWSLALFLLAKILKKPLNFTGSFNLVVYASVLPLLLTLIQVLAPSPVINLFGFGLFIYFTLSWFLNLPPTSTK